MNKFSENDNKSEKYAGSDILRNKIFNLIEETLSAKVDGTQNTKITINGKDELVEELHKYVTSRIIVSKIQKLKEFKANPKSWELIEQPKKEPTLNVNDNVKFEAFGVVNEGKIINRKYTDVSINEGKDWVYFADTSTGVFPIRDYHVTQKINETEWTSNVDLKYVEENPDAKDECSNWIRNFKKNIDAIVNETNGRVNLIDIKGIDMIKGPCAKIQIDGNVYECWTIEDGDLWIENYIIDNTSKNGIKSGFEGRAVDIINIINSSTQIKEEEPKIEEKKLFLVTDDEFNLTNYPYLIGKKFINKPAYVIVSEVAGKPEEASDYKS